MAHGQNLKSHISEGTQTPKSTEELPGTKQASQQHMADALTALDHSRNRSDALRERLRTYVSSMKGQSDDLLRASSKCLSQAMDKANEFKTYWNKEIRLRQDARNRADEMEKNVKAMHAKMKGHDDAINTLSKLLGIGNSPKFTDKKLEVVTTIVQNLLALVEKVQNKVAAENAENKTNELAALKQKFETTSAAAVEHQMTEVKPTLKDQSVHCNLATESLSKNELLFPSGYNSKSLQPRLPSSCCDLKCQLHRSQTKTNCLLKEVDGLKRNLAEMKTGFGDMERTNLRLRSNLKQLNSTLYHEQDTTERLRYENRFLKSSTSKLLRRIESQEQDLQQRNQRYLYPRRRVYRALYKEGKGTLKEHEKTRLETIPESSDEGLPPSLEVSAQSSTSHVAETMIVSPGASIPICSFSKKAEVGRIDSVDGETKSRTSAEKRMNAVSTSVNNRQASHQRKRSRKSNRSSKSKLPIWRQEHPDNIYHTEKVQQKFQLERNCYSRLEDVSETSNASSSPISQPMDEEDLLYGEISPQHLPPRVFAMVMSETEFERLVEKAPIPRTKSSRLKKCKVDCTDSLVDDGYHSPVRDASKAAKHGCRSNETQLLSPSGNTSDSFRSSISNASRSLSKSDHDQCLVKYNGTVFNAMKFDLVKMRKFTWESGISNSDLEMKKFFDFLALKAQALDDDPKWVGRHNLGKSSDWIDLKNEMFK